MVSVNIDPHMAVIQVHVGQNLVDDVLLDGGFGANIITKDLRKQLKLLLPKPIPYMFWMADQNLMKPVRIIWDLKIHIHEIPHISTFTVMQNNVLGGSYSMLLGWPWLRNAKVICDRGTNLITIEGNGAIRMILVTKRLDVNTKWPKVLLCYDFTNDITNEEEEILLQVELELFTIGTISLPKLETVMCYIFPEIGLGGIKVWFSSYTRGNYSRWSPRTLKGVRFENCLVDVTRRCPNLRFEFGHCY